MILPDILKNAPFFKKIDTKANKAASARASRAKQQAAQRAAGGERKTPGMPKEGRRTQPGKNPSFN